MVIRFKAKVEQVYNADDTPAFQQVRVPRLARKHVDMTTARKHPKYGAFANSDLFPSILARIRAELLPEYATHMRLDRLPEGVTVDTTGFLAVVTIER